MGVSASGRTAPSAVLPKARQQGYSKVDPDGSDVLPETWLSPQNAAKEVGMDRGGRGHGQLIRRSRTQRGNRPCGNPGTHVGNDRFSPPVSEEAGSHNVPKKASSNRKPHIDLKPKDEPAVWPPPPSRPLGG